MKTPTVLTVSLSCLVLLGTGCKPSQPNAMTNDKDTATVSTDLSGMKAESYPLDEFLKAWKFYGVGAFYDESGRQACLEEGENTSGTLIVSPKSYTGDVVVRYKVMTLNPATVMITLLSLSDRGTSADLTLPEGYDGNMGYLEEVAENYFIAYRNSPHATTPFIRKHPDNATLVAADEDCMLPGVYYDIETGRQGNRLWLKVDDRLIVETTDESPLSGGHVAIRARGLAGHPAACVIRDVTVYSRE